MQECKSCSGRGELVVKMKESGIEWIGKIPETWSQVKFNALYNNRNMKVNDKDYVPLSVTKKGIVPQLETAAKTNDNNNRKLVKAGDFVINSRSDRRGSCGISSLDGSVSLINTVLKPQSDQMDPLFFNFLFHTTQFADEFYKWGHGIVDDLWTTNWQDMKNITLILPPILEQRNIAKFLNTKTLEIDKVSNQIADEIEKLRLYENSLITHAVTKGLDSSVLMKKSNVEWIDEIPQKWEMKRLEYIAWVRARLGWKGLKAEEYVDHGYPLLSAFNIVDNKLDLSRNINYITKLRFDESPEIKLSSKDIIIVKDGAGIGKCARIDNLDPYKFGATVNSSLAVISANLEINYKYLYFYLISNVFKNEVDYILNGMGVPHLTLERLKKIPIAVPPIDIQNNIAKYLDKETEKINKIINLKQRQLSLLNNYKNSLIFEYTTGKKQVPSNNR